MTAIQGGVIGALGYDEVLALTYSGWVVGFTTEPPTKRVGMHRKQSQSIAGTGATDPDEETAKKISNLKYEFECLLSNNHLTKKISSSALKLKSFKIRLKQSVKSINKESQCRSAVMKR